MFNLPWANPRSEITQALDREFTRQFPQNRFAVDSFNAGFTFEAIMIAADGFRRAGATAGPQLMEAIRATNIERHVMIGARSASTRRARTPTSARPRCRTCAGPRRWSGRPRSPPARPSCRCRAGRAAAEDGARRTPPFQAGEPGGRGSCSSPTETGVAAKAAVPATLDRRERRSAPPRPRGCAAQPCDPSDGRAKRAGASARTGPSKAIVVSWSWALRTRRSESRHKHERGEDRQPIHALVTIPPMDLPPSLVEAGVYRSVDGWEGEVDETLTPLPDRRAKPLETLGSHQAAGAPV